MKKGVFITKSFEETQKLGIKFARYITTQQLKNAASNIIALYGDLGSGKTTFVQGLAKGLGIKKRIISPTFIIMRKYKLSIKDKVLSFKYFYHIDLYRIKGRDDIRGLGLEEILNDSESIVAIEWAEKLGRPLSSNRIDVKFSQLNDLLRKINIKHITTFEPQRNYKT